MKLFDIVSRDPNPKPWTEVSKIPWDDPDFSSRMLREHLSQDHDAASRRISMIDRHVDWIHSRIMNGDAGRILDLGCGPGLYCTRLAELGHECTGIDFGPASIDHARRTSQEAGLDCEFILGDLRETPFGADRDAIMLLFGEFNTFHPDDSRTFMRRTRDALSPDGRVLLEVHTLDAIRTRGNAGPSWSAVPGGLFSAQPHIRLDDFTWHEDSQTSIDRHFVIDAASGDVTLYGTTTQAYSRSGYEELLHEAGFSAVEWHEDWPNVNPGADLEMVVAIP